MTIEIIARVLHSGSAPAWRGQPHKLSPSAGYGDSPAADQR
jgi:hypothetical protein